MSPFAVSGAGLLFGGRHEHPAASTFCPGMQNHKTRLDVDLAYWPSVGLGSILGTWLSTIDEVETTRPVLAQTTRNDLNTTHPLRWLEV